MRVKILYSEKKSNKDSTFPKISFRNKKNCDKEIFSFLPLIKRKRKSYKNSIYCMYIG